MFNVILRVYIHTGFYTPVQTYFNKSELSSFKSNLNLDVASQHKQKFSPTKIFNKYVFYIILFVQKLILRLRYKTHQVF